MHDKTMSFRATDDVVPTPQTCVSTESWDPLFSRKEAAAYLGLAERTLAIWAVTGRYGLQMVKIGRLAKYRKSTLDRFINERTK
jgi:hypothetical protein